MALKDLISLALKEDFPDGDLTTDALGLSPYPGRARLVAKDDLVLSGVVPFEQSVLSVDSDCQFKWLFKEGEFAFAGQTLCQVHGDLVCLLKSERTALNFLGHLCGIATYTRCFVNEMEGTSCQILDTRKTLPGYRELEKKAVVDGAGTNHRMSLSEAILIKENHIRVSGGIDVAVARTRKHAAGHHIEIETRNLQEVRQAVEQRVDRILLDNMDNATIEQALQIIPSSVQTEASGNMTIERVGSVAALGVDFISVGAITHSAPCADVSLLFEWEPNNV